MLNIKKNILYDENNNPVAVQIPYNHFKAIEEAIENYGLAKLIEEVKDDEVLDYEDALNYYKKLKKEDVGN